MGHIWTRLFKQKDIRILLLGLNGAGKTTILYRLKLEETVTTIPTIGFNIEKIQHKDVQFVAWDIGDRDKMRPLYKQYFKGTNAVVFVIDSTERDRLDELNYDIIRPAATAEELAHATFLFLANKKDLHTRMNVQEIVDQLGLKDLKQTWTIIPVSALHNEGLYESLDWLALHLCPSQFKKSSSNHNLPANTESKNTALRQTSNGAPHQIDYCARAYSAIKCLFVRTGSPTSDDDDNKT